MVESGSMFFVERILDYGGAPVLLLAVQWFRQDKRLALHLERMRAGFDKRLSLVEQQLRLMNNGKAKR